jgi:hypothetical protein
MPAQEPRDGHKNAEKIAYGFDIRRLIRFRNSGAIPRLQGLVFGIVLDFHHGAQASPGLLRAAENGIGSINGCEELAQTSRVRADQLLPEHVTYKSLRLGDAKVSQKVPDIGETAMSGGLKPCRIGPEGEGRIEVACAQLFAQQRRRGEHGL